VCYQRSLFGTWTFDRASVVRATSLHFTLRAQCRRACGFRCSSFDVRRFSLRSVSQTLFQHLNWAPAFGARQRRFPVWNHGQLRAQDLHENRKRSSVLIGHGQNVSVRRSCRVGHRSTASLGQTTGNSLARDLNCLPIRSPAKGVSYNVVVFPVSGRNIV
jgi:hypothetical protein